jgi:3-hydroxyacyl-CoA dehydrogenase
MNEVAPYTLRDGVAVITLNNPPVNGLGNALRAGILQGLQRANQDPAVKAAVLIGAGKSFSGGADIREFGKSREKPDLPDVNDFQDAMRKPLVAAISGFALGGGLELALACHYRIATPKAQLGLPEVKLGILPGSGGTQRLPRIVPVAKALEMMTTGNPISAEGALQLGLVDEIVQISNMSGDLLDAAVVYANQLVAEKKPLKRIRDMQARADVDFQKVRDELAKASRGYPAPLEIVACVEAAVTRPFDEGRKFERERFAHLVATNESKALRHAFFAERQTSKIPDVPDETPTRTVKKAAVIGAGTMGGGIAMSFVTAGIPVTITDTTQEALDRGMKRIRENFAATVSRGRLKQEEMERRLSLLRPTTDLGHIKDADIVVEAVFERMDVKQELFRKLDALMKPGAILATNTSTLDVNQIAEATKRPQDVIGTHFFSPANVMRLLEVVRGAKTGKDVLATTMKLGKALKKVAVVSARSRSTAHSRNGAWRWARSPCTTWRATTSAGRSASAAPRSAPTSSTEDSPTASPRRAGSARRPAAAGIAMSPGTENRSRTPRWSRCSPPIGRKWATRSGRSATTKSSSAACTRSPTRARRSSRKASRCAPPTSTWSISPATASRRTAAGRCFTRTPWASTGF